MINPKIVLLALTLPFFFGKCQSPPSVKPSIEQSQDCTQNLGFLDPSKVESIDINDQQVTKSGKVRAGNDLGYTFNGRKDQLFKYTASPNLKFVILTPLKLIDLTKTKLDKLPIDGQYLIQICTNKRSDNFQLTLELESLELSQVKAQQILQGWLDAKAQVFGKSYDQSTLNDFTTGAYYQRQNSSLKWLRDYSCYYDYKSSKIQQTLGFSSIQSQAKFKVKIAEELYLHCPKGIDEDSSGLSNKNYLFTFVKVGKTWKIAQVEAR